MRLTITALLIRRKSMCVMPLTVGLQISPLLKYITSESITSIFTQLTSMLFSTSLKSQEEKLALTGRVREIIYNTLNENHVEIPFPQRDVHIKNN